MSCNMSFEILFLAGRVVTWSKTRKKSPNQNPPTKTRVGPTKPRSLTARSHFFLGFHPDPGFPLGACASLAAPHELFIVQARSPHSFLSPFRCPSRMQTILLVSAQRRVALMSPKLRSGPVPSDVPCVSPTVELMLMRGG